MFGRYGGERTSSESQSVLYMSPFEQPSRGSMELTIVGLMRSLLSANFRAKAISFFARLARRNYPGSLPSSFCML